jgi:uncharacterized membrane protein YcaP (DUF421 family)
MAQRLISLFWDALGIGLDPQSLTAGQMTLRSVIVYGAGIVLIRLGDKRFLGRLTAFDAVMGVLIGSVLGRAINGNAPFFGTLIACAALVVLHRVFALAAFRVRWFGRLIKGDTRLLVRDGEPQRAELKKSHITQGDLEEMLRLGGGVEKASHVRLAYYERNGQVSVIL